MVQLNRSMMERYEIADRRPEQARCMILGADAVMLGCVARLLDGKGIGAVCATAKAEYLAPQDGMFTMLVRGENLDGKRIKEERVVQSILSVCAPEEAPQHAAEAEVIFCHAGNTAELATAALVRKARIDMGLIAPRIIEVTDDPAASATVGQLALAEALCGSLGPAEAAAAQHEMNYKDDFIAWAEPFARLTTNGEAPEAIAPICSGLDYAKTCDKKKRIFDSAVFLCAAAGFLAGKKNFAEVLRDEAMRAWIGHSFFDEILPTLPYEKDEIAPDVISAFERLENPMNDMPLLETGRNLLGNFCRTILPSIRAYADKTFEAPIGLSFALASAIFLYAGARRENGGFFVARGDEKQLITDDPEILDTFARFSHDMPAETLAYAALADRSIWGCDLREIDGLEMRIAYDLSSIQRIGFGEALKLKTLEWAE